MKKIFVIFSVAMIAAMMSGCFRTDCDCEPYEENPDNVRMELIFGDYED